MGLQELILEVRYVLRSLGVALDGPSLMLGDNMSVVLNTTVPSSVKSEENVSDVSTKPLGKGGYSVCQRKISKKVIIRSYRKFR
jgi:hypothetical protein